MENIFNHLLNLILANIVALLFMFITIKISKVVFGFSLGNEVKQGNKAAAFVFAGIFIMIGLVTGLFSL